MFEVVHRDLFPDEVAEEIRDAGPDAVIRSGFSVYHPARMQCEDGIYTSGAGLYTEYINGRRAGTVGIPFLCNHLAHKTFSIRVNESRVIADLNDSVPLRVLDVGIGHYIYSSSFDRSAPGDVPPDIASLPAYKVDLLEGVLYVETEVQR